MVGLLHSGSFSAEVAQIWKHSITPEGCELRQSKEIKAAVTSTSFMVLFYWLANIKSKPKQESSWSQEQCWLVHVQLPCLLASALRGSSSSPLCFSIHALVLWVASWSGRLYLWKYSYQKERLGQSSYGENCIKRIYNTQLPWYSVMERQSFMVEECDVLQSWTSVGYLWSHEGIWNLLSEQQGNRG